VCIVITALYRTLADTAYLTFLYMVQGGGKWTPLNFLYYLCQF